ncbi:MAG: ATP-NAD kinase family protein [Promethearchaeota archaeon]|jgi:predicted polyphosphate/ATP-dependent NAD kinase
MKKIGLILNPIAGMGGSVGLKGTDGDIYKEALKLGAEPIVPLRVSQFLLNIKTEKRFMFLVAPSKMGEDLLKNKGFEYEVIGEIGNLTTAKDTKRIANQMIREGIELLVFCGGDGTARDIYDTIGLKVPVIAIPSGVKMYSSVFAFNPRAAAQLLDTFIEEIVEMQEKEVLDIDENLYRKDVLETELYGYLKVPKILNLIQPSKSGSGMGKTIEENKQEIAQFIIENMESNTLYLLGPGTTVKTITDVLKLPKTLLGVDAIDNRTLIGIDLNEKQILELIGKYKHVYIIISPIGGQGFIFGRGNKQFTPEILRQIDKKNIKIIATRQKIQDLECLRVDTGNLEVDEMFKGLWKIIIGYMEELVFQIKI